MSRKGLSFLMILLLTFGFTTLRAEVQNVKVGGDIEVRGYFWQRNVDLIGENSESSDRDWNPDIARFFYQIASIYISADLTENVNAYIKLINDRTWGNAAGWVGYSVWTPRSNSSNWDDLLGSRVDLSQAYLKLADMFGYPVTLIIGRQNLLFGEGFIVGDRVNDLYSIIDSVDASAFDSLATAYYTAAPVYGMVPPIYSWTLMPADLPVAHFQGPRKAFDAVRLTSLYNNSTIDIFYAQITEGFERGTDEKLSGINWNLKTDAYGTWDFGLFYKVYNPNTKGKEDTLALSIRGAGEIPVPVGKLAAKGEIARQTGKVVVWDSDEGKYVQKSRRAWGGYAGLTYTFDNPYEPYVSVTYTRLTGDKSETKVGTVEAWDPMYENPEYGILADAILYGGRPTNAKVTQVGVGFNPNEKVKVALDYYNFEEDQHYAGLSYTNSRKLGTEWDLVISYDYSEDVQFSLAYAQFNTGTALDKVLDEFDIDSATANALIGTVKVTF